MRVVLDTNVFISGIFWEGNACSKIIELWRNGKFTLISSHTILEEFVRVLRRFKIKMDEEMIEEWQKMILENATIVEPLHQLEIVKADPSDNKFFELFTHKLAKIISSVIYWVFIIIFLPMHDQLNKFCSIVY